ncbi:MAG: hypothetical protein E6J91_45860 [Deltaproteobacteria bacterium]|nr:MAG: hypothetical protein E6J91_45860 [Deltaproteobacteria bacterium]
MPGDDAIPGIDAMMDGSTTGADAPSNLRCDPGKPFGTPIVLSALSSSFDEVTFALSGDELTAFLGRVTAGNPGTMLSTATRGSAVQAFGAPTVSPMVAAINSADGAEYSPSATNDALVLYFHRQTSDGNIGVYAALRADAQSNFDGGSLVNVGGSGLTSALAPVISADGQTLYWLDFQNFQLHSARRQNTPLVFGPAMVASTIPVYNPVLSRDELTLYYANGFAIDVLVSTRLSKNEAFGTGVPAANVNSSDNDAPVYLTTDGCVLYLSSKRSGGSGGYDFWEARRPL